MRFLFPIFDCHEYLKSRSHKHSELGELKGRTEKKNKNKNKKRYEILFVHHNRFNLK